MDTEYEESNEEQTPRMEDIHPRMTANEKALALKEILRVLRGKDGGEE